MSQLTRSVQLPKGIPGILRLHSMPGRYESLDQLWNEIRREGIELIVCLATPGELREKSPAYAAAMEANALPCSFESFPIADYGVPEDRDAFWALASKIAANLRGGRRVLVHCAGGIGRSGTLATCVLLALGATGDQAMRTVSTAGARAEAAEQRELISWCAARADNAIPHFVPTQRLSDAFAFACAAHANQARKGTTIPYIAHLMGVASLVLEHGADEDTTIAALLHDAAEDQGGRAMLEQIRDRFGEKVAKIVEGCTDTFENPKPDWAARKVAYIDHLQRADFETCLVAAADKLHNARAILHDLRNIGPHVFERFSAPAEQTGWYYASVARVLHRRLAGTEAIAVAGALYHAIDEIAAHKGSEAFRSGAERGKRGEIV